MSNEGRKRKCVKIKDEKRTWSVKINEMEWLIKGLKGKLGGKKGC